MFRREKMFWALNKSVYMIQPCLQGSFLSSLIDVVQAEEWWGRKTLNIKRQADLTVDIQYENKRTSSIELKAQMALGVLEHAIKYGFKIEHQCLLSLLLAHSFLGLGVSNINVFSNNAAIFHLYVTLSVFVYDTRFSDFEAL